MAKPDGAKVEKTLRKVVREAIKSGEEVSISRARERAERKLGLEAKSLKSDEWREKSKSIIKAAFEEPAQGAEQAGQDKAQARKKSATDEETTQSEAAHAEKALSTKPEPPRKSAAQVNGVKRKASDTEPDGGDGGGSPASASSDSAQSPSKKAKVNGATPAFETTSNPASEDSSEEEGGSRTEDSAIEEEKAEPAQPRPTSGQKSSTQAIAEKEFKPPTGFAAIDIGKLAKDTTSSDDGLRGKQIWHITAPSNVPLSALNELTLSSIEHNEPLFSHKDVPYILSEDRTTGADATALLAPSKNGYHASQHRISRTLHLQQKIDLPNLSATQANLATGSHAAGDVAQASVSTIKPQPKGLRMRYKPPGFGKGRPGRIGSGSDDEDGDRDGDDARPSLQFPKTLGQHGVEVTQDGDVEMVDAAEVEGSQATLGKTEKKRKEKDRKRAGSDAAKTNSAVNGQPAGNMLSDKQSKEEKRKRKEERRAKKDNKGKL